MEKDYDTDLPPPLTPRRTATAVLLGAALMLGLAGGADADPATGMIDGSYAAQMPAYYLHKTLRPGVARVCVAVTGTTAMLTGTVRTQDHDGDWTLRRTISLMADSGTHVPPSALPPGEFSPEGILRQVIPDDASPDEVMEYWMASNPWWRHNRYPADHSPPHAVNPRGGRENCDFYAADDPKRPVNWCRWRRSIKPAHGWTGHLTSDSSVLRVQVRDHILNMPGPVGLAYNSTCP